MGIGDQKPFAFEDARFRSLGVAHSRYIVPWNAVLRASERKRVDEWVAAARAAGVEPLIAFNHATRDRCPRRPCHLPSIGAYRRAFAKFRRLYPHIRSFQPWNEANHQSQPTARSPKRAAQYFNAMRQMCRSCRIVAADVLDSSNMERWLAEFRKFAKRPRLWGLHNYGDTNRFRRQGTERMLRAVPGRIWITESGGIVRFRTHDGRVVFREDERRAARATRFLFRLARKHSDRIERLYLYHFSSAGAGRFDSGLVAPDGRPRPSYYVVRNELRRLAQGR